MPKSKHTSDSDDSSDSDPGPQDRNPKKQKVGTAKVLKNDEGCSYWEMDRNKRITVREFRGKVYVDIREFYEKDGKILPGKKGISLSVSHWSKLKSLMDEIDDAVSQM